MSRTAIRRTDAALVVVPVAERGRALELSFARLGFEKRTDPDGRTLFVVERT